MRTESRVRKFLARSLVDLGLERGRFILVSGVPKGAHGCDPWGDALLILSLLTLRQFL